MMMEQLASEDYRTLHNLTNISDNVLLKRKVTAVLGIIKLRHGETGIMF